MKTVKKLLLLVAAAVTTGALNGSAQSLTLIHTFSATTNNINADGLQPRANLVLSGNTLFGTTGIGGPDEYGTVFSVNTNGSNFTLLHSFTGVDDGAVPSKDLALSGGALYGLVGRGTDLAGYGSIFSVDTNGSNFNLVYTFTTNTSGALGQPNAGLLVANATIYGVAYQGGITNAGSIFSVSTNGTNFTLLHLFNSATDGENPYGVLTLSGNTLYDTARNGGSNSIFGSVFSINTNGSNFTVLHTFGGHTNADGANPDAGLILSGDTLYGTTSGGGSVNGGTVFSITTNGGAYTIIHSFNVSAGEGKFPEAGVFLRGNTLYGTTLATGTGVDGTIYSVNTDGSSFTLLHTYTFANSAYGYTNSDGSQPYGGVTMSGNYYGTTFVGGPTGMGTIYSLVIAPQITNLSLSANHLVLNGINAVAGNTFIVLASTNVALPVSQWTSVATNFIPNGGNFSLVGTNAVNPGLPRRFYVIEAQ